MIKKLFGAVVGAAKAAGKAKSIFDDYQAKLEAASDDLDGDKIPEKEEILSELGALKAEIPAFAKDAFTRAKPLALRVKDVSLKTWGLALHVFNTTANSKKG